MPEPRRIAVLGLGYVGLPVAAAFARGGFSVVGFDIDEKRIGDLQRGEDHTREVNQADLRNPNLKLTNNAADMAASNFYIVTVPTPVDSAKRPDLGPMWSATACVGGLLKSGDIVVYESTVYPGAVEETCVPILEQRSGLKAGEDFGVGYSPERANPGDAKHRFETITKVVAAQDGSTLKVISDLYGSVVSAGLHAAPSIRVAEAAKVIENAQRDLNIAFMNELSSICEALNIDTHDVIAAARTKWNFLPFYPGLVGGHCIGVDPYYLTHRAEMAGYHPQVILAGRRINDSVGFRIGRECVRRLLGKVQGRPRVTILGLAFKENVPDIRNSKVVDIVQELRSFHIDVQINDPLASSRDAESEYGLTLTRLEDLRPADAVVLAVAHDEYVNGGWPLVTKLLSSPNGIVLDVKAKLDRAQKPAQIDLWRL